MRLAFVVSAHGYGHATRSVVLADALADLGHAVTLFTAAPPVILGRRHAVRPWAVDVGLCQRDSLHEDVPATLTLLEARCGEAAIDALAEELRAFDAVVVDVAPAGLEAARRAGVPAVAVGNFDWAWVYRQYPALAGWAERFAAWQAPHPAIALTPGPGLQGFRSVAEGGLLARTAPPVCVAPIGVLVCFGGFGLDSLAHMLPEVPGVTWVLAPPMPRLSRADIRYVDDVPFPALVAGASALLTKPGYGVLTEASVAGTPIVWVDRGAFPEAPSLERVMLARGDVKVGGPGGGSGEGALTPAALAAAVRIRLGRPRPTARPGDDRRHVARLVLVAVS